MGYLLMMSHDQYKQYQERMIKIQNKPVHTMPIARLRNEKEFDDRLYPSTIKEQSVQASQGGQRIEQLTAKITGKGKYINEYI